MGLEDVKKYFKEKYSDYNVTEVEKSTATVELAAKALGVEPSLIAKTLSFKLKENRYILLVPNDAANFLSLNITLAFFEN